MRWLLKSEVTKGWIVFEIVDWGWSNKLSKRIIEENTVSSSIEFTFFSDLNAEFKLIINLVILDEQIGIFFLNLLDVDHAKTGMIFLGSVAGLHHSLKIDFISDGVIDQKN